VADPFGGSWFMESITDRLERDIWDEVLRIEAAGTATDLVEGGFFRSIFDQAADRHARRVHSGEQPLVGVNCHTIEAADDQLLRDVAEERFPAAKAHVERIRAWRPTRDGEALERHLEAVRVAAATGADLMAPIMSAFQGEASMGEITGALREGVGWPADPFARRSPASGLRP
jgi:methylmalonyl-CoA mutase N-terminal domain/subunit